MDHRKDESPLDSSSFPISTNTDHCLKQLNKLSHNISKPNIKKPTFDSSQSLALNKLTLPESQPHVYNISKNDFRDMVQKLTGSPGHTPPQPKPVPNSRLHRLRPPPLPQVVTHRLPPHSVEPPSPLPPFPTVHAESPVSLYMRFLRSSMPSSSEWEFQIPSSPVTFGCFNSLGGSPVHLSPTVPVSSPGLTDL